MSVTQTIPVHTGDTTQIYFIDLLRSQKLARVIQIHLFAYKHIEQVGIDMPVELELSEDGQRFGQGLAYLVRPVFGGQGFEDIRDAHHPGLYRHLIPYQPARVTLAIHALVMAARVFRYVLQVFGPGQGFQHLDGDHDVVIDDLALRGGERAGTDGEILDLIRA